MGVRRRLDPLPPPAPTAPAAARPPPRTDDARPIAREPEVAPELVRALQPTTATADRSAARITDDVHRRSLLLARSLRDAGRTDEALGVLEGLRHLTPARGVPSDAAFLEDADDATATDGRDRLEATIEAVRSQPRGEPIVPSLRLSWFNDQFFYPNGDDDGFTQAANVGLTLRRGDDALDLDVRHGMLTERGGDRRVDELDILATLARRIERGNIEYTFGSTVGMSLVGDYGGAELQDAFHGAIGMGRRLDGTLQDRYEGTNQHALIIGAQVSARRDLGLGFAAHGGFDGQLALGPTGISRFSPRAGVDWELPEGVVRPYVGAELEVARFFSPDARLEMAGGYDTRHFEAIPRFSIGIRGDLFELGWRGTMNQNGSGANMGEIYLSIGRR